jgi:hypothetical protein
MLVVVVAIVLVIFIVDMLSLIILNLIIMKNKDLQRIDPIPNQGSKKMELFGWLEQWETCTENSVRQVRIRKEGIAGEK